MNHFAEDQRGGAIGLSLIIAAVVVSIALLSQWGGNIVESIEIFLLVLVIAPVYVLFYRLKTEVDDEFIHLTFGLGLIKKKIAISSLESAEKVRNKWYYGWGIRFYGSGWMWNYTGLDAVELTFKGKKAKFRIGTREADILTNKLNRLITSA